MQATDVRSRRRAAPGGLTSPEHGDALRHPRGEILALTGIRAVAAIAVVLHHLQLPASAPQPLRNIADAGFIGVPLFFMLSGLVLAWNYPALSPRSGSALWRFYLARIARVMPLYWVILAFLMLRTEAQGRPQAKWWWQALAVHTWSGDLKVGQQSYNGPAWSVCVEIFLYLLFPFVIPVIAIVARRHRTVGLVVVAAAAFAVQVALVALFTWTGWAELPPTDPRSAHRWIYRNPLTRLPDFVIGICIAFAVIRGVRVRVRTANLVHLACAVYVVGLATVSPGRGMLRTAFFGAIWTVPFALLLLTLATTPRARAARFLATPAMVSLGAASYALYLTHRWLLDGFGHPYLRRSDGLVGYLYLLGILGLCLLVAEGAHRYVEVPARKLILGRLRKRIPDLPTGPPDTTADTRPDARPDTRPDGRPGSRPGSRDGAEHHKPIGAARP